MKHTYSPSIPPRHLRFSIPENPSKYWHSGSDIKTYHFNALALFLPQLEKMLVLSLKKGLQDVICPTLKSEVASLVAQEAIHGRAFAQYCKQIVFSHYACPKQYSLWFFRVLAGLCNRFSSTFHYALSAAGEHFTAIAADLFLRQSAWFTDVPPAHSAIWRWHCIEEIEHKSVAFDVFEETNGNYFVRVLGMLMMSLFFLLLYVKPIWCMMKQDQKHKSLGFYRRALQFYLGKGGLFRSLRKSYCDYFKPSFHPAKHQNDDLITQWKIYFSSQANEQISQGLQFANPPKI